MKKILALLLLVCSLQASAQSVNPIEIVVPFAPGGLASIMGLMTAEILNNNKIPTVVIHRPGADGTIGANSVARVAPDGRTLLLGTSSVLSSNLVFGVPGMEYTEKSFVPIVPLGKTGLVLVTHEKNPIKNLDLLKFYVKANPEKFNIGVWNTNLGKIMQDWAHREGLPAPQIVVYKGSNQLLPDVYGGHVLLGFDTWPAVIPLAKDQKLQVLATLDKSVLREVKAIKPQQDIVNISKAYPDLEFSIWYGLFAPTGTSQQLLQLLNTVINNELQKDSYRQKLRNMDIVDYGGSAESLHATQRRSIQIMSRLKREIK